MVSHTVKYAHLVVISVIIVTVSAIVDVLPPYILKTAIDSYITNSSLEMQKRLMGITTQAMYFLGVISAGFFLNFLSMYLTAYTGARIVYDIRRSLFRRVLHLPMSFFDKTHSGVITTRITNDTQNLMEFFTTVITSMVKDIFLLAGIIYMLLRLSSELFGHLSPILVAVVVATVVFRRYARALYRKIRSSIAKINSFLAEHIAGMDVVQAFEVRDLKRSEFGEIADEYYSNAMKQLYLYGTFRPFIDWLYFLGVSIIVWFGAKYIEAKVVGIGTLMAFANYLDMFFSPIRDFAEKFDIAQSSLASAEKISMIMEQEEEELGRGGRKEIDRGIVELRNVWFAYEDEKWVLKNVSVEFRPGTLNAVVGETGAGKTSLLSLLNLTYRPQKGTILIDGTRVEDYDLVELRKNIAVVPQEVVTFSGTILDNVRLFDERIPEDEVVKALKKVHAMEVFSRFEKGIHTEVTERGKNLSAGERQLIALARAVLFNAKILILDEATSSVDVATESRIQKAVFQLAREKTVITIAHRLSTVKDAGKIVVVHAGEIVEEGDHSSLMKKRGHYYRLYKKMRMEGYRAEDGSDRRREDRYEEASGGVREEF